MSFAKIKKLVKQCEKSTGLEPQNFNQLEKFDADSVANALYADIRWHQENLQEQLGLLEQAASIASYSDF